MTGSDLPFYPQIIGKAATDCAKLTNIVEGVVDTGILERANVWEAPSDTTKDTSTWTQHMQWSTKGNIPDREYSQ